MIEDPDWEDYEEWVKEEEMSSASSSSTQVGTEGIVYPSDVNIPNPIELGFDVCATWSDGTDYYELCLSAADQARTEYYDCAGRYIKTVSMDVSRTVYDYRGMVKAEFSLSFWVGMDDYDCLHAGVGSSGDAACIILNCPWDPTYTTSIFSARQELMSPAEEIADWIYYNYGGPAPGTAAYSAETALIAAVLFVAILVVVASPTPP